MRKVLLVEDEPPILYMVKEMIESAGVGFEVAYTAFNGRDALKQLRDNTPDVLITDIRMPYIDGLQLIKEVKQQWPEIPCIVLSGYSDFNYAREALQLQAFDYVLKPIKDEVLMNTLTKVADYLERGEEDRELEYVRSLFLLSEPQTAEPPTQLAFPYFYPVLIRAGNYSHAAFDYDNPGRMIVKAVGPEHFQSLDGRVDKIWCINGVQLNEKILVLAVSFKIDDQAIAEMGSRIMQRVTARTNLPVSVSIGQEVSSVESLGGRVYELRLKLSKNAVIGETQLFIPGEGNPQPFVITNEMEQTIKSLVKLESYAQFEKTLQGLIEEWRISKYPQYGVEALMETIVRMYRSYWSMNERDGGVAFDANEFITGCISFEGVNEQFRGYMKVLNETRLRGKTEYSAKELISRIESYLEHNYMYPITNDKLQEMFGYNKIYISNVFSEVKGIPPSKYMAKLRIRKAIEMMSNHPDMPLKQIAEHIGYEDALYFSRVFKNATGLSPKEYKETHKEGGG
jgi:two-component system response regulator YesN